MDRNPEGAGHDNKERKQKLERAKEINCSKCPYHRRENSTRRIPRNDKYKSRRRERAAKLLARMHSDPEFKAQVIQGVVEFMRLVK